MSFPFIYSNNSYLRRIDISLCKDLENDSLLFISTCTNITYLNMRGCINIDDDGIQHLSKLGSLYSLNLFACQNIGKRDGLISLVGLTNLTYLNLGFLENLEDNALEVVSNLVRLKELNLSGCEKMTDFGINRLINLTNLKNLDMRHLRKISNLDRLLAYCRELEFINISGNNQITIKTDLPGITIIS